MPVALAGLQGRYAFTPSLFGEASVAALPRVKIDQYSGRALDARVALEWRFARVAGIGAAYHDFELDGTVDQLDFRGTLDLKIRGPEVYVKLAF